jgi:drug/metabolite transporter (DMT)-like permease
MADTKPEVAAEPAKPRIDDAREPEDAAEAPAEQRLSPPVAAAFLALCFLWGSTYLFIKIGVDHWPAVLLAAFRNLLACLAVVFVLVGVATIWRRPRPVQGIRGWWPAAGFGILQGTGFALIFWGERYITSGQTAVLIAFNPIFTLPLARWWIKEPIKRHHYVAVLFGVVGVALVAGVHHGSGFEGSVTMRIVAQVAVLGAALCYAVSLLFSRKYMHGDRYVNTAINLGASGFYLLLLSLLLDRGDRSVDFGWTGMLSLLYLALPGSALAYYLLFYLIENLDPVQVSYVTLVNPVVAVVLGIVFLSEPFTWMIGLGTAAVVLGTYHVHRPLRLPKLIGRGVPEPN